MAWWSNKQKPLIPWDHAKEISKKEAEQSGLSLGWYVYQDGYVWYGLKPNAENTDLERSFHRSDPKELESWLGVPVPEKLRRAPEAPDAVSGLAALVSQAKTPPQISGVSEQKQQENTPPDQELAVMEREIQETEEVLSETPSVEEQRTEGAFRPSKGGKGRVRNNEIHVWLSDAELTRLRRRVQRSGLNQSEFLRRAALNGKIVIEERDPVSIAILDEMELIRAELGRQGGLLKMIIKPNEGQRQLAPEEWDELIQAVRFLENTKKRLGKLEEKI